MLDIDSMPARLGAFLTAADRSAGGSRTASVVAYEAMSGGYSRLMARADVVWSDGTAESLVLRGDPPPGQAMMETSRDTEHAVLSALVAAGTVPMPAARYYDATGEQLGTKCIVLDLVPGRSLHALLNDGAWPDGYGTHVTDLVDTMARVHSVGVGALAGVLPIPTDWDEYLGGLIDRFRQADRSHAEPMPFLRYVAAWLDANRPPPLPLRLVHSDFQAANIMVDATGTHQVIDWELAHVGDPREDLGYYNVYSSTSGPNLLAADPEAFLAATASAPASARTP